PPPYSPTASPHSCPHRSRPSHRPCPHPHPPTRCATATAATAPSAPPPPVSAPTAARPPPPPPPPWPRDRPRPAARHAWHHSARRGSHQAVFPGGLTYTGHDQAIRLLRLFRMLRIMEECRRRPLSAYTHTRGSHIWARQTFAPSASPRRRRKQPTEP